RSAARRSMSDGTDRMVALDPCRDEGFMTSARPAIGWAASGAGTAAGRANGGRGKPPGAPERDGPTYADRVAHATATVLRGPGTARRCAIAHVRIAADRIKAGTADEILKVRT